MTIWPSIEDERRILGDATGSSFDWLVLIRALLFRIRELEAERMEWNYSDAAQTALPLTKARITEAAQKLFVSASGWRGDRLMVITGGDSSLTLPDVVHLLCEALGVKE